MAGIPAHFPIGVLPVHPAIIPDYIIFLQIVFKELLVLSFLSVHDTKDLTSQQRERRRNSSNDGPPTCFFLLHNVLTSIIPTQGRSTPGLKRDARLRGDLLL